MSSDDVALVVAVLGVGGTLASAVISQSIAKRSRLDEMTHQDRQRAIEIDTADAATRLAEKKDIYIRVNATFREYVTALNNYLHQLSDDILTDTDRSNLHVAKGAARDSFSELQLIAPDDVLAAASKANNELGALYGLLRRLERTHSPEPVAIMDATSKVDVLWELVGSARRSMRIDLGVE